MQVSLLTATVASSYFDVSDARRAMARREETAQAEARLVARLREGGGTGEGGAGGALASLAQASNAERTDKLGVLKDTNPRVSRFVLLFACLVLCKPHTQV